MGGVNMNVNGLQFNPAVNEALNIEANHAENPVAAPNGGIAPGSKVSAEEANRLRENYTATHAGRDEVARGIDTGTFSLGRRIGFVLKNILFNIFTLGGYGYYQIDQYRKSNGAGSQPVLNDDTGLVAAAREKHADAISSFKFAHRTSINRLNRLCAETVDKGGDLLNNLRDEYVGQEFCTQERFDRIVKDYRDTLVGYAQVAINAKAGGTQEDDVVVRDALIQALNDLLNLGVGATEPQVEIPQEFKNSDSFKGFFSQFKNRLMCECADVDNASNRKNEAALRAVINIASKRCTLDAAKGISQETSLTNLFSGFEACDKIADLRDKLIDIDSKLSKEEKELNEIKKTLEGATNLNEDGLQELKNEISQVDFPDRLFDGIEGNDNGNIGNLNKYLQPQVPRFRFKLELLKLKSDVNNTMDKATLCKTALLNSMRIVEDEVDKKGDILLDVGVWKGVKGKEAIYRELFAKMVDLPNLESLSDMNPSDFSNYLKENKSIITGGSNGNALAALLEDLDIELAKQLVSDKVDICELLPLPDMSESREIEKYNQNNVNYIGSAKSLCNILNGLGDELKKGDDIYKTVKKIFETKNTPRTVQMDDDLLAHRKYFMSNVLYISPKSFLDDNIITRIDETLVAIKKNYPDDFEKILSGVESKNLKKSIGKKTFDKDEILKLLDKNFKDIDEFKQLYKNTLKTFQDHSEWTKVEQPWDETFDPKTFKPSDHFDYLASDPLKSWKKTVENLKKKTEILNNLKKEYEKTGDPINRAVASIVLRVKMDVFVNDKFVQDLKEPLRNLFSKSKDFLETYKAKASENRGKATFDLVYSLCKAVIASFRDDSNNGEVKKVLDAQGEWGGDDLAEDSFYIADSLINEIDEIKEAIDDGKNLAAQIKESKDFQTIDRAAKQQDTKGQAATQIHTMIVRYLGIVK